MDAGGVRATEIEPGFSFVGRPHHPCFSVGNRQIGGGRELGIEGPAVGIELNSPPQRGRGQHLAGLPRRGWAGASQGGIDVVEAGLEDGVVDPDESLDTGELWRRRRIARRLDEQNDAEQEDRRAPRPGHVTLVRSPCFAACLSTASAISRSRSSGYDTPLAAHIFEYMLIVVNPGIVFTSLT